jgi:hypothetical protein
LPIPAVFHIHQQRTATNGMNATLEFNPDNYSERSLRLILAKAQEWQCTPAEAVSRLLDELAKRTTRRAA